MNEEFRVLGYKPWIVTDNALIVEGKVFPYVEIGYVRLTQIPTSPLTRGTISVKYGSKVFTLTFNHADMARAHDAFDFMLKRLIEVNGIVEE